MKYFTKILFAFVCLFGVGMINADASVLVNGTKLTDTNTTVTFDNNGSVTWNSKDNTLTINNVNYSYNSENSFIQISEKGAKIILKGKNVITNTGSGTIIHGAYGNNSELTITGDGSLKSSSLYRNIWVTGDLKLDGANIDVTSTNNTYNEYAIEANALNVVNKSNVKVVANGVSIGLYSSLNVSDSELNVTTATDNKAAIKITNTYAEGNATIKNSTVKVKGTYMAIQTFGNVDVDNSNLDLTSDIGIITYSDAGSVTLKDSDVTANVYYTAVYAPKTSIDNTEVTVYGTEDAFYFTPSISNLGSKVVVVSENADGSNASIIELTDDTDLSKYKYVSIVEPIIVTADADNNSKIQLSNTKVIKGSTVEAVVSAKDGYKLTSVLVNGKEMLSELKDGKLTLTVNENTTIKATSEVVAQEKNPNTGDQIVLYVVSGIVALMGISYIKSSF